METLLENLLNEAMRVNTFDNSDLRQGIFIGMVQSYNMLSSDKEITYTIVNDKIIDIDTEEYIYLWNEWNKDFDWRKKI